MKKNIALTTTLPAIDSSASPQPGTALWYQVQAMNACGTAFPPGAP